MLEDFRNIVDFSITTGQIVENLLVALVCSIIIAFFYRVTYKGPGYSVSFLNSLIVLSLITAIVIMVIGNNLARAFGLVGTMSIIRFRTAVKETLDIVYIFFALSIGMAAGVGFHGIAFAGTLFVGTIIWILTKSNIVSPTREEYLLQFIFQNGVIEKTPPYQGILDKYCKNTRLLNVKSILNENALELAFYVTLKDKKMNKEFVQEMMSVHGIRDVNLYFDEGHF